MKPINENIVFSAIEFAAKAHAGQYRKGTKIPYITHPLAVAEILIECGCSEKIVAAGILHDTIEDTPVSVNQIKQTFGDEVALLVEGVSEPDKSNTWENRKQHTIEFLKTAPMNILVIVCADKFANLRSIAKDHTKHGESIWSRFHRPKEKQRWYYQSLVKVLIQRIDGEPGASLFRQFQEEVQNVFDK